MNNIFPTIDDVLTGLGVGRSLTDDPQVLSVLDNLIETISRNYNETAFDQKNSTTPENGGNPSKRSASAAEELGTKLVDFFVSADKTLINLQKSWIENTREDGAVVQWMKDFDTAFSENGTVIRWMKDFDTALAESQNNTVVVRGIKVVGKFREIIKYINFCIFVDANLPKKRRRQIANDYLLLLQVEPIVQRAAQRIDMGLRYAQNAWIEGTKENGTILQIMKDFDNAALAFRNGSINVLKSMSSS